MIRREDLEPSVYELLAGSFRRLSREVVVVWLCVLLVASAIGHMLGATVHAPGCPAPAKVEFHQ